MKKLSSRRQPDYIPDLRFRIFAVIIDWFIFGLIFIGLTFILGKKETTDGAASVFSTTPLSGFISFLAWLILFPILEGMTGQTIGKKLNKIRVIRFDFSPISISSSLRRHIFDIIDFGILFGLVALITASSNDHYRRLGDLFAMTMVVKDD